MSKHGGNFSTKALVGWRSASMIIRLFTLCLLMGLLLAPSGVLAFDFKKMLKDKAESMQQHLSDTVNRHVNKGEQKAEETIDRTLAGQTSPVSGSLQARVTEVPLGKYISNPIDGQMIISEDGGHVAIARKKGSRQVMVVDGAEGPVFDEVIPFHSQFAFAGQRFAYVGRRGEDLIGVVDGQEVGRIGPNNSKTASLRLFHFSADGSRLVYLVLSGNEQLPGGGYSAGATPLNWGPVYMVVDGKRSPGYAAIDMNQITFGGNRLAYAAQTADKKWHVVVDGKMGPAYEGIRSLHWSGNGTHYAFVGKRDWQNEVVVVDGKEGKAYPDNSIGMGIDALSLTANGHVAYRAQGLAGSVGQSLGNILVLDQQEITREASKFGFEHTALLSQPRLGTGMLNGWFALSPDGRRIAYVKKTSGGQAAVIDGKAGFEYDKIFDLQFSPDSRRVAYIGQKGLFNFVVVDGAESPAYGVGRGGVREFRFTADGRHYAFEAVRPNTGDYFVVVDGQAGPLLSSQKLVLEAKSLLFSANSEHFAYAGNQSIIGHNPQWALIVDGEMSVRSGKIERFQKRDFSGANTTSPVLVMSPDGSRLAYIVLLMSPNEGGQRLFVDNQTYPPFNSYSFPVFSPDGRHFAVAAWSHNAKKQVILVDGKEGPAYDKIVQATDAVFRFLDDRTLRFLAVRDGSIYRVTIDVGG